MKLFSVILILIIVLFTSCDGKKRANFTNEEQLEQSKLSDSFFERVKYEPEQYMEVITDTLINNNISIKIKSYTDMNNNVLNEFKVDSVHYKHFYREIISDLTIAIDGNTIFNETIDKSYFKENEDTFFWEDALMLGLYLNDSETTSKQLFFNVSFCMIESEICKDYHLIIDKKGTLAIKELPPEELH